MKNNKSEANKQKRQPRLAPATCSAARWHCVFCKEPLTRPGKNKWWIAGSSFDEGLCYDCILAGMRVIMAGVEYAQKHEQDITETSPPNAALCDGTVEQQPTPEAKKL